MAVEVPSVILPVDQIPFVRIRDAHLLDAERSLIFRVRVFISIFFSAEVENDAVFVVSLAQSGRPLASKNTSQCKKLFDFFARIIRTSNKMQVQIPVFQDYYRLSMQKSQQSFCAILKMRVKK